MKHTPLSQCSYLSIATGMKLAGHELSTAKFERGGQFFTEMLGRTMAQYDEMVRFPRRHLPDRQDMSCRLASQCADRRQDLRWRW